MNYFIKEHMRKGFTLIELLIVIGIIGALAVAALMALNPAEAQRKSRDTQRLRDMQTLQGAIESYLQDNPGTTALASKTSSTCSKAPTTSWLGSTVNMTGYLTSVPCDPSNGSTDVTDGAGATSAQTAVYSLKVTGRSYKLCTYLESTTNKTKLNNKAGATAVVTDGTATNFAVASGWSIDCP